MRRMTIHRFLRELWHDPYLKHGLWFRYDGAGYQVTASTCNTYGTLEDTKITVYLGTCTDLACVGGNDNDIMCIVGGRSYRSTFSWCALPGAHVLHSVGSAGPTYGTFRLELTEGSACTGACCMPNGTCIEVTSATCELAGGIFHGVGSHENVVSDSRLCAPRELRTQRIC